MTTPTTFVWTSTSASVVQVAGSWDGFTAKTELKRQSDGTFQTTIELEAKAKVLCKFIVDGQWLTKSDLPTEDDGHGNLNNVIHVGPAQLKPSPPSPAPFLNSVPTTPVVPAPDAANQNPLDGTLHNKEPRLSISGASAGGIAGASAGVMAIAASFVSSGAKGGADDSSIFPPLNANQGHSEKASSGTKDPYVAAAEETVAEVLGPDALRSKNPAAANSRATSSGAATPLASAGPSAPHVLTASLNGTTSDYDRFANLALKGEKHGADAGAAAVAASAADAVPAAQTTNIGHQDQELNAVSDAAASSAVKSSSAAKATVPESQEAAVASDSKTLPPGLLVAPGQGVNEASSVPAASAPKVSAAKIYAPVAAPGVASGSTKSIEPVRKSVAQGSAGPGGAAPISASNKTVTPNPSSTLTPSQSGTFKDKKSSGSRFSTLGRRKSVGNGLDEAFDGAPPASPGKTSLGAPHAPSTPSKNSAAAAAPPPVTPVSDRKRKQSIFGKIKDKLASPSPSKQ